MHTDEYIIVNQDTTNTCVENISKILHQIKIHLVKGKNEQNNEEEQSKGKKRHNMVGVNVLGWKDIKHVLVAPRSQTRTFKQESETVEDAENLGRNDNVYDSDTDPEEAMQEDVGNENVKNKDLTENADEDVNGDDGKSKKSSTERKSGMIEKDEEKKGKLQCSQCDKSFSNLDSFSRHAQRHQDGFEHSRRSCSKKSKKHACKYCDRVFNRRQNLLRHIKSHLNEREFQCQACGKAFNTQAYLKIHSKTHDESKRHQPDDESNKHPCEFCGKKFKRGDNLVRHVKIHINERAHKCITCGKGFNTRFSLKMHMKIHEGPVARTFACEYCGKSFYRRGSLVEHIRRCLNLKTYKCELCGKGFNNISGLNSHAAVHQTSKDFTCELCGKAFKRLLNMKNHMKVHLNEKHYKCTLCGKGCNTSSQLAMHKKMHETGRNYSCEICSKAFKYRHGWKNHTATHSDEKRYQCNVCGKRYHSSSILCSHRKHCNSDGQQCTVCHQVIIGGRMIFKRHMKMHPLEFPCELCGKVFKRKDIMKRHMEIHLNERKYQCAICNKAFNTSSQLGTHKNKVHKISASGSNLQENPRNVNVPEIARVINIQEVDGHVLTLHEMQPVKYE